MALSEDKLDEIIRGFVSILKNEMPIHDVILFGSYAQGKAREHSDIDLAIISDWFSNKTHIESMQYLSRIAASYNSLIEALPFTIEEYKNFDKRTFLANVLKTGRRYPVCRSNKK